MGYVLVLCEGERELPPYVEALKAAGLPAGAIRTVTPQQAGRRGALRRP
jgi:hypothetical protein